ncbi:hypothetical protein ESA94_02835 [Lacibacter luteus]|uniref:Uncharacterized protein n=1 Tax=Lacibacter luteus TaxID=2508719 RepID=A0A4Q1CLT7_9BACT|nr:hypothetical protein [Lacibacter luteus]RXK61966.1 hypothetical protein ESA94_02835 [Lacibacter luteus]
MRLLTFVATVLFMQLLSISSCKKPTPSTAPAVDLSQVKITAFEFAEATAVSVNITHPVLVNGEETTAGRIEIIMPEDLTGLQLTPLVSNFLQQEFTISPQLGIKTDYENKEVLYTITSTQNTRKKLRYKVVVQKETAGALRLTDVQLLQSSNPQLGSDIHAAHILHSNASIGKVYLFVPAGTNFSSLTAKMVHNGSEVRYTQNAAEVPGNSANVYPANGQVLDFAYPKGFYVALKRGNETVTYSIVVDVVKPVAFTNEQVTLQLATGVNHQLKAGELHNRGNRPITINQIVHADPVPALSPLRTFVLIPSGGLLPGQKADVITSFDARSLPAGAYEITAKIRPGFVMEPEAQTFLQTSDFKLKAVLQ